MENDQADLMEALEGLQVRRAAQQPLTGAVLVARAADAIEAGVRAVRCP